MKANGQGRVPLYLTETAFPVVARAGAADRGPAPGDEVRDGPAAHRPVQAGGPATGGALGLQRVYWYTWSSGYRHPTSNFEYAGLLAASKDGLSYKPQPALCRVPPQRRSRPGLSQERVRPLP